MANRIRPLSSLAATIAALAMVAAGCGSSSIESGTVTGKYYQEAYNYSCQVGQITIMSGNTPIIIPMYGECWHNECYWLALRDDKTGEDGGYCITRSQFSEYKTGDHWILK